MEEDETFLDICLRLHMSLVGSSDPLERDIFSRYVKCLELAVECWDHSHTQTALFDNAVLNLVVSTLAEIKFRFEYTLLFKESAPLKFSDCLTTTSYM